MSVLITALKREHQALKNQVAAIKQAGVVSAEGFAELQRLRNNLKAHLQHEDRDLYPRLAEAARDDVNLQILLDRFQNEMQEIATDAERFFERYPAPEQSVVFARDIGRIFSLLGNRIITEESVLYPRMVELGRIRFG
ncbi:hemerythrin domain-containing protein [Trichlorobacter lovleyi]|uniref:hemerythrin domain-containing protein n=1 Tax=Trichlorobacter lovleyi TaxID=313985 RepID=UPI0024814D74|nr:hemerythrin domain-containing protein [Trichlorobacter lovleyi]